MPAGRSVRWSPAAESFDRVGELSTIRWLSTGRRQDPLFGGRIPRVTRHDSALSTRRRPSRLPRRAVAARDRPPDRSTHRPPPAGLVGVRTSRSRPSHVRPPHLGPSQSRLPQSRPPRAGFADVRPGPGQAPAKWAEGWEQGRRRALDGITLGGGPGGRAVPRPGTGGARRAVGAGTVRGSGTRSPRAGSAGRRRERTRGRPRSRSAGAGRCTEARHQASSTTDPATARSPAAHRSTAVGTRPAGPRRAPAVTRRRLQDHRR